MLRTDYTYTTSVSEPDVDWSAWRVNDPLYRIARNTNSSVMAAATLALAGLSVSLPVLSPDTQSFAQTQVSAHFFRDQKALLFSDIIRLTELEPGWDGSEEDVVPSKSAADDAINFIQRLPPVIQLPEVMVSADGELGLLWDNDETFINVSFFGNGKVAFYATRGERASKGVFHVDSRSKLPVPLSMVISELA